MLHSLIPPEFLALMVPSKAGPKIIGWTFQLEGGIYYANNRNGNDYITMFHERAYVYTPADVYQCSRNKWSWGHKNKGKWRAVYAY